MDKIQIIDKIINKLTQETAKLYKDAETEEDTHQLEIILNNIFEIEANIFHWEKDKKDIKEGKTNGEIEKELARFEKHRKKKIIERK